MKKFILTSGSVHDQGTVHPWSSLYNTPHSGTSTLTLGTYVASEHLQVTMVDIATSGSWLIIVSTSRSKPVICVKSCF